MDSLSEEELQQKNEEAIATFTLMAPEYCFRKKAYIHRRINHSKNMVDPNDPLTHTQVCINFSFFMTCGVNTRFRSFSIYNSTSYH